MAETSLLNYVPFVTLGLTCLRAFVPYAALCLRALRTFGPYVPFSLLALITRLLCLICALYLHTFHCDKASH